MSSGPSNCLVATFLGGLHSSFLAKCIQKQDNAAIKNHHRAYWHHEFFPNFFFASPPPDPRAAFHCKQLTWGWNDSSASARRCHQAELQQRAAAGGVVKLLVGCRWCWECWNMWGECRLCWHRFPLQWYVCKRCVWGESVRGYRSDAGVISRGVKNQEFSTKQTPHINCFTNQDDIKIDEGYGSEGDLLCYPPDHLSKEIDKDLTMFIIFCHKRQHQLHQLQNHQWLRMTSKIWQ